MSGPSISTARPTTGGQGDENSVGRLRWGLRVEWRCTVAPQRHLAHADRVTGVHHGIVSRETLRDLLATAIMFHVKHDWLLAINHRSAGSPLRRRPLNIQAASLTRTSR